MSYLRPLNLQPPSLKQSALNNWLHHILHLIRDNQIISRGKPAILSPTYEGCLKVLNFYQNEPCLDDLLYHHGKHGGGLSNPILLNSSKLLDYLDRFLPVSYQEEAFHRGAQMLRKEVFLSGDMFPVYFCLLWRSSFRHLDIPPVQGVEDRITVLDYLSNRPPGDCSSTESAKFRILESTEVSIEESYLLKRILRSLCNLKCLVLW